MRRLSRKVNVPRVICEIVSFNPLVSAIVSHTFSLHTTTNCLSSAKQPFSQAAAANPSAPLNDRKNTNVSPINMNRPLGEALAARTGSAFREACEAFLVGEKKRCYAVFRPSSCPSPSDYVDLLRKAKQFRQLGTQGTSDLDYQMVKTVAHVFLELWNKPVDGKALHAAAQLQHEVHVPAGLLEWVQETPEVQHEVIAATMAALPPHEALLFLLRRFSVPRMMKRFAEEQEKHLERQNISGELSASQQIDALYQCALAPGVQDLKTKFPEEISVLDLLRSVTVFHAVVQALILMNSSESKAVALDLLEKYVFLRMQTNGSAAPSSVEEQSMLMVGAAEAAAITGDDVYVTRLIFLLYRSHGALGSNQDVAPSLNRFQVFRRGGPFMDRLSRVGNWLQATHSTNTTNNKNTPSASFDVAAAELMRHAIRAACNECDTVHAYRLFEALKPSCSWLTIAAMGTELLEVFAHENLRQGVVGSGSVEQAEKVRGVRVQQSFSILSRMASLYPAEPTTVDDGLLHRAIVLCMQLHFSFILLPSLPEASSANPPVLPTSKKKPAFMVCPVAANAIRALELFDRLPTSCSARKECLLFALSAAVHVKDMRRATALMEEAGLNFLWQDREALMSWVSRNVHQNTLMLSLYQYSMLITPQSSRGDIPVMPLAAFWYPLCSIVAAMPPLPYPEVFLHMCEEWLRIDVDHHRDKGIVCSSVIAALLRQSWGTEPVEAAALWTRCRICLISMLSSSLDQPTFAPVKRTTLFVFPNSALAKVVTPNGSPMAFQLLSSSSNTSSSIPLSFTVKDDGTAVGFAALAVVHTASVDSLSEEACSSFLASFARLVRSQGAVKSTENKNTPAIILLLVPYQFFLRAASRNSAQRVLDKLSSMNVTAAVGSDSASDTSTSPTYQIRTGVLVTADPLLSSVESPDDILPRCITAVSSAVTTASSPPPHVYAWSEDPVVASSTEIKGCVHISTDVMQQQRTVSGLRELLQNRNVHSNVLSKKLQQQTTQQQFAASKQSSLSSSSAAELASARPSGLRRPKM